MCVLCIIHYNEAKNPMPELFLQIFSLFRSSSRQTAWDQQWKVGFNDLIRPP